MERPLLKIPHNANEQDILTEIAYRSLCLDKLIEKPGFSADHKQELEDYMAELQDRLLQFLPGAPEPTTPSYPAPAQGYATRTFMDSSPSNARKRSLPHAHPTDRWKSRRTTPLPSPTSNTPENPSLTDSSEQSDLGYGYWNGSLTGSGSGGLRRMPSPSHPHSMNQSSASFPSNWANFNQGFGAATTAAQPYVATGNAGSPVFGVPSTVAPDLSIERFTAADGGGGGFGQVAPAFGDNWEQEGNEFCGSQVGRDNVDQFSELDTFYTGSLNLSDTGYTFGQYTPYGQLLDSSGSATPASTSQDYAMLSSNTIVNDTFDLVTPYTSPGPTVPMQSRASVEMSNPGASSALHGSTSSQATFPSQLNGSLGGLLNNTPALPVLPASLDPTMNNQALAGYSYLYSDPTRSREEINKLLTNIRSDEDLPPELREGTPDALRYPLMEHQKLGLAWLKKMEGTTKGGILADDMGLGKTIQALALIVSKPSDNPALKTTLIIAPVALMRQWRYEIQEKLKDGSSQLSVYTHHGASKKKVPFSKLCQYDVVLTTFGTLAAEKKRKENPRNAEPLSLLGDDCRWYRVIVDEAQNIKNSNTKASKAACDLEARSRFCLTGTPMMNNLDELGALIHFLRIKPYRDLHRFRQDFTKELRSGSHPERRRAAMTKLQALCKAIMLRRTKESKIDGRPLLILPPRTQGRADVEFSHDEMEVYRGIETDSRIQFNKYVRTGTIQKSYSQILLLLLRLRQACCHPHLIKDFNNPVDAEISQDAMLALAARLSESVVGRIKSANGAFECPICYDAVENPAIIIPCGHDTCSECFSMITDPARAIAQGDENAHPKCPECRGKIDTNQIIDYRTFKKVHLPEECEGDENQDADSEPDPDSDSESEDSGDDSSSLDGFVVHDSEVEDGDANASGRLSEGDTASERCKNKPNGKSRGRGKGKGRAKPKKTLAQLKKESQKNKAAKRKYLKRLRKTWISSAKIDKTLELLDKINEEDPAEKTIIFSQFTSLLDLLEVPIADRNWEYRRYDGSMKANDRNDAVLDFMHRLTCKIMLVSLKAGNAGLNLTAASRVIILDPFWNPYIEHQAIDRAHRIGQLRPVHVYRVLVPDTVEDRILALQEKKEMLISEALDEQAGKNVSRLGLRELEYLFGIRNDL